MTSLIIGAFGTQCGYEYVVIYNMLFIRGVVLVENIC